MNGEPEADGIISVINMIQNAIVSLPSEVRNGEYFWSALSSKISIIAIIIIIGIVLGGIYKKREWFNGVCIIWVMFSIVLFVILNWTPYESPLFSILFSWAIIPLFVNGVDSFIHRIHVKREWVYSAILAFIIVRNVMTLVDINHFLACVSILI